ncbi:S26 family signal peptidase [Micromonospora sp. DT68]|uniref:S26 family signal peptidase n=1 Tax=Micromonospora sp. DT68 TaxID=3416522 RepID=UPI003CEE5067
MPALWIGVLAAVVVSAGGALALRGLRRRQVAVRVSGQSMEPSLRHGDLLLVRRCAGNQVTVGDIVVFEAPGYDHQWSAMPEQRSDMLARWLVKRVAAVPGDPLPEGVVGAGSTVAAGTIVVIGDSVGYDSRTFGPLPHEKVLGRGLRLLSTAGHEARDLSDARTNPGVPA